MARTQRVYRHVECATWDSADFTALTAPEKPSAQFLWLYLMTGPQTGPVPGLYRFSIAEAAERFGWSVKGTRAALEEILVREMALYDAETRILWLPKAIGRDRNAPASPNVIRSWRRTWSELPSSGIKTLAAATVETFLKGIGEGFVKAFHEVIGEDLRKAIANPSRNQEQEQESLNKAKSLPERHPANENLEGYRPAADRLAGPDVLGRVGGGS
jgi:hypothetical protein